jgi:hypothetical protein
MIGRTLGARSRTLKIALAVLSVMLSVAGSSLMSTISTFSKLGDEASSALPADGWSGGETACFGAVGSFRVVRCAVAGCGGAVAFKDGAATGAGVAGTDGSSVDCLASSSGKALWSAGALAPSDRFVSLPLNRDVQSTRPTAKPMMPAPMSIDPKICLISSSCPRYDADAGSCVIALEIIMSTRPGQPACHLAGGEATLSAKRANIGFEDFNPE